MQLESLGARADVFHAFEPYAAQNLLLARITQDQRSLYHLQTENDEYTAELAGRFWHTIDGRGSMPVVGDWVAARAVAPGQATIEALLPRRTLFSRRAAGRRAEQQPIAANIDLAFLVCGLDEDFNLRRLERFLTVTAESGAVPVVVLNKSDACTGLDAKLVATREVASGAPVIPCSAREGQGLDGLFEFLTPGRTAVLLGSSGVGKSTIINALLDEQRLRTGAISTTTNRGRHTTTHRELIVLPRGGILIDTPGLRELQLWAGESSVGSTFDDIACLAASCRYRDCAHTTEPGCAVQQAIIDGALPPERLTSYNKLRAEARHHETTIDALAAQEHKRMLKLRHKWIRKHYEHHGR